MDLSSLHSEFQRALRQFNPWWSGTPQLDLPAWRRAAFRDLKAWGEGQSGRRALLIAGARQVGKTTLLLQMAQHLLEKGVPQSNILYATFDHPILKLAGIEETVRMWRELEPTKPGPQYLLLDEIQVAADWQVWIKHQVDFAPDYRIAFTGSASPISHGQEESGVGRWSTVPLPTLSFYEFLQIRNISLPDLPMPSSLAQLFAWPHEDFGRVGHAAEPVVGHFHDYLVRGGFPECAQIESIPILQKLLREDIVDKVLKRDMTAFYGVRNVLELERLFLYLCIQNGGEVNVMKLSGELRVSRKMVEDHLELLVATHLLYPLKTFGFGKEVLKGKTKYYLADPAIAPSVLLHGRSFIDDEAALGMAVESAAFKHIYTHYFSQSARFSYWYDRKAKTEVDIVAEIGDRVVPFEVKYRQRIQPGRDLAGIYAFGRKRKVTQGYLLTRSLSDFGIHHSDDFPILFLPASLACLWLGASEHAS